MAVLEWTISVFEAIILFVILFYVIYLGEE